MLAPDPEELVKIRDNIIALTLRLGERGNPGLMEPSLESRGAGLHCGVGQGQDLHARGENSLHTGSLQSGQAAG